MWIGSRGEQWRLSGVVRVLAGVVSVLDAVHGKQSVSLCSHFRAESPMGRDCTA